MWFFFELEDGKAPIHNFNFRNNLVWWQFGLMFPSLIIIKSTLPTAEGGAGIFCCVLCIILGSLFVAEF